MNTQDILNLFVIFALLIFASCVVYVTIFTVLTLKAVRSLADYLRDTSENFNKNLGIKTVIAALPSIVVALIGRFLKRR